MFYLLTVFGLTVYLVLHTITVSSLEIHTSPKKLNVVIDTDPGSDDAMAILMMLSDLSNANVLAITTTSGCTGARNATRNAKLTLKVAERSDIPVYTGSEHGLAYPLEFEGYFGWDGLGDVFSSEFDNSTTSNKHAGTFLAEIVRENPGKITVLAIGPLTNIALALHQNPDFLNQVKELVFVGGSYQGGGNKMPGVEYSIHSDPEAAALVFSRASPDKPLTVIPLETVFAASLTKEWRVSVLGKIDSCKMDFLNKAERIAITKTERWYGFDQMAAAVLLQPNMVTSEELAFMTVETCGSKARGAVFRGDWSKVKNTRLVTAVNKSIYANTIINYIKSSPGVCI